jgi:Flp pilus assembly pilin Flp
MQNHKSERGQTNVEYGLILVIVSIAVVAVLALAAGSVIDLYENASTLVSALV